MEKQSFSTTVGGTELTMEITNLAGQANASVLGTYGDTVVLATAVMTNYDKTGMSYFPLRVDYEERFYAAGKILGSRYVRREGRPSQEATLNARLIDRSIRPLFDHAMRRDVQVVATILQIDEKNDPDFIGLMCASTALAISDIPWNGPISGIRISKMNGEMVVNPTQPQREDSSVDIFVAGTKDRINMIETGANEAQEDDILALAGLAHKEIKKLTEFQESIIEKVGKEKQEVTLYKPSEELEKAVRKFTEDKLEDAVYTPDKLKMKENIHKLQESLKEHLEEQGFEESDIALSATAVDHLTDELIHKNVLENDKRPDGRGLDEVRNLEAHVGLLNRMHGSGLFMRGNTHLLSVATLAAPGQEQLVETMEYAGKKRFMHHYNFPAYSVGEVKPFYSPGRREIGHGALAEKAIKPLLPPKEDFPYTIRVVSETLSSNGSSSMASVCASSLALMDAGVPMKKPVAGIAMGVITGKGTYKILTDIQGPEDHHGDMDLKVAGTEDGITAMQMDVKIEGITVEMLEEALEHAKNARMKILDVTNSVLSSPRPELSPHAPRVFTLHIDPEKIRDVIGPGGKVINSIIDDTGVDIDIEQDGSVYITGDDSEMATRAMDMVKDIVREFQVGEVVEGEIVKILDFGAILQITPQHDGMIHISEIAPKHVNKVEDYFDIGDKVKARIVKMDKDTGRIGLSTKEFN